MGSSICHLTYIMCLIYLFVYFGRFPTATVWMSLEQGFCLIPILPLGSEDVERLKSYEVVQARLKLTGQSAVSPGYEALCSVICPNERWASHQRPWKIPDPKLGLQNIMLFLFVFLKSEHLEETITVLLIDGNAEKMD